MLTTRDGAEKTKQTQKYSQKQNYQSKRKLEKERKNTKTKVQSSSVDKKIRENN